MWSMIYAKHDICRIRIRIKNESKATGGRIMSKIVNITSKEDKDQKLQDIANSLEELKDVMAEVIEAM